MAQHYIQAGPALSSPLPSLTSLHSLGENAEHVDLPERSGLARHGNAVNYTRPSLYVV